MAFDRIPFILAERGVRFQFLKTMGLPGKPEALSMEVTRRCMGRCVMCNIWQVSIGEPAGGCLVSRVTFLQHYAYIPRSPVNHNGGFEWCVDGETKRMDQQQNVSIILRAILRVGGRVGS